jgi:hypothetical protein
MTQMQTETDINEAHKKRWAEAAEEHGSPFLPPKVAAKLNDLLRLDWCAFYSRDTSGALLSRVRHPDLSATHPKPVDVVQSAIANIVASEVSDD